MAADDTTTISGKMFADLTNYDASNDGVNSASNGFGLDVKRFYLGVTHNFDDIWSVNVTSDFNYVGNDSETQLFIKKAYFQAKLSDAFVGRLGSADLPWVPFVEDLYGYRFVENMLIDRLKFGTSADWGLHAGGKVADGKFNYAASVINGAGYKNPTRSNSMDLEARVGFLRVRRPELRDRRLHRQARQGHREHHHAGAAHRQPSRRGGGLGEQVVPRRRASISRRRTGTTSPPRPADKADGFSVWGSFNFSDKWGVFARGDSAKTSKDLSSNLKDEYFNAGVVSHPRKNIDLAFVYKHEKVDGGGVINTSNGNFGGLNEGKYDEVGIWTQVAF